MPATLRDVAERAQVSIRTVSNVVSGYAHVSDKMRKRVLDAIDELDYRPNPVARTLRTGRTGMLALVVPEIDVPYFSELARDVINAAAEVGYRVMIDQTGHDHERERELLTGGDRTMLFDGILFAPLVTPAGAQPDEEYSTPQQRTAGFESALADAGLAPVSIEAAAHYRRADGYQAARALLERDPRPDAIFCYSDLLAMGALRAVFDAGLRVPEDVAIIGIDDIEEGRYSRPSLSTVSLDTPFIAAGAVARIAARIDDPDAEAVQLVAPHTVIPRESTLGR
jgi:DNA-binding LacI/PurR family transcriptional regulator